MIAVQLRHDAVLREDGRVAPDCRLRHAHGCFVGDRLESNRDKTLKATVSVISAGGTEVAAQKRRRRESVVFMSETCGKERKKEQ